MGRRAIGKDTNYIYLRNTDIARFFALMLVVIYHIYAIFGATEGTPVVLNDWLQMGGELGVTAFFVISGYGIYYSCRRMDEQKRLNWFVFMGKRIYRIGPEYYFYLIVSILGGPSTHLISPGYAKELFAHFTLLQTFYPNSFSCVNGAFWTMSIIAQYYIIAIPMYYLLRKTNSFFPFIFMSITIGYKIYVSKYSGLDLSVQNNAFYWMRQTIPAVIDNFALGMYGAQLHERNSLKKNNTWTVVFTLIFCILLTVIIRWGILKGVHNSTVSGIVWHTIIAVLIAMELSMIYDIKMRKNFASIFVHMISENEYGIYIVHLPMIIAFSEQSGWITYFREKYLFFVYVVVGCSILFIGIVYSQLIDSARNRYLKRSSL